MKKKEPRWLWLLGNLLFGVVAVTVLPTLVVLVVNILPKQSAIDFSYIHLRKNNDLNYGDWRHTHEWVWEHPISIYAGIEMESLEGIGENYSRSTHGEAVVTVITTEKYTYGCMAGWYFQVAFYDNSKHEFLGKYLDCGKLFEAYSG